MPAIEAVLAGKQFVSGGLEFRESTDAQAPHRPEILFCSDDEVLLDSLTRFIAAALNARNAALVLVTESHRASLLYRLNARGVDINGAIHRGTYISLDADETPDPVPFFEAVRGLSEAASKAGKEHPRVVVWGERAGRLWAEGKADEAIQFEQFGNELAKSHDVDILCAYPTDSRKSDAAFRTRCRGRCPIKRSYPKVAFSGWPLSENRAYRELAVDCFNGLPKTYQARTLRIR